MTSPFAIRAAAPSDMPFIVDSWILSFRTSYSAGLIAMSRWHSVMWPEISEIVSRPSSTTLVAELPTGRDRLIGFICGRPHHREPWVHYTYTKSNYRQAGNGRLWPGPGVARCLFDALGVDPDQPFVHSSKTAACSTLKQKIPFARWNPLVARFDEELRPEERSA